MLYSVRMRSAKGGPHEQGGRHISGAERILEEQTVDEAVRQMLHRARSHTRGKADFINIRIEAIDSRAVRLVPLLPMLQHETDNIENGRKIAKQLLLDCGITEQAADRAFKVLLGLKESMRGAVLLDAISGERRDSFQRRGVRVSHMDVENRTEFKRWLNKQKHQGSHVQEAIVLAAKVASAPGIQAELCWSDDPDYRTGYVTAQGIYHRITPMKQLGDARGGRVFFIRPETDLEHVVQYLQEQPVLIDWKSKGRKT